MKNILKKIGLIAIIVGVLSPFITLPNVNAATTSCDYHYHINQYLFLDVFTGSSIDTYEVENLQSTNEVGKRNFTNFIYTFPALAEGETLSIVESGSVDLMNEQGFEDYYKAYKELINYNTENKRRQYPLFGDWIERDYEFETITTLVHGRWAREDGFVDEEEVENSVWKPFKSESNFKNATIQNAIANSDENVTLLSKFGGASYNRNTYTFEALTNNYNRDAKAFINQVITDYNDGITNTISFNERYLVSESNVMYFNMNIDRRISKSDLEKLNYGYVENGVYKIIKHVNGNADVTNSYEAMLEWKKNQCTEGSKCTVTTAGTNEHIDIDVTKTYYWPAMYNVEYSICKTSDVKEWTLTYDRGVSSEEAVNVTNMPNPERVTGLTGTTVTLSSTKPERKDYVFKSWCTEKDGKGTCIEAGKVFENKEMIDDIVYAYWVKPGTENNEKQGVMSYVIGFIGVGIITSGLYFIINKKNLFKQI